MSVVGRLQPRLRVDAYIPSVENMPGPHAVHPGDVLRHYGGRTVEVLNTDAEGRLILADALAYASERGPDAIIDAATLTGTISLALGRKCSGYFANDDALAAEIEDAARSSGERVWRMPLIDDYRSELESPIADVKNVGIRYGGAIIAALFLSDFVAKGVPWIHFDIAGTARADADYDEMTRGGTGAITRTLINWIERRGR
jgi:leucyl aminopeptidase